jgi:hypothetical protein
VNMNLGIVSTESSTPLDEVRRRAFRNFARPCRNDGSGAQRFPGVAANRYIAWSGSAISEDPAVVRRFRFQG